MQRDGERITFDKLARDFTVTKMPLVSNFPVKKFVFLGDFG